MESVEASQAEKTMIAQAPGAEATLLGTPVKCPVCGTENSPSEKYCGDCGFLLSSTPGEPVAVEEAGAQARLVDAVRQREFVLRAGENTVGREGTDILLDDATVSRRHAVLLLDETGCFVEDLGSTNGTFVDGRQIGKGERTQITDGTELKFGNSVVMAYLPQSVVIPETEPVAEETEEAAAECEAVLPEEEVEETVPEAEPDGRQSRPGSVEPVARLVLVSDPSTVFDIRPGANGVGRRTDSDIPITFDGYVSGIHCDIIAENGEFYVSDMGSTNGTFVNGDKVLPGQKVPLSDGDELTVGQTVLRFEVLPAETGPEEAE